MWGIFNCLVIKAQWIQLLTNYHIHMEGKNNCQGGFSIKLILNVFLEWLLKPNISVIWNEVHILLYHMYTINKCMKI